MFARFDEISSMAKILRKLSPLGSNLFNYLCIFFKVFIKIHQYANEVISYWTTGCKDLSKFITDDIKKCINGGLMMVSG